MHSVFGASKVAADVMVQEYGRYFGMRTAVLPRRLPDRAGPLRRGAARLPRLPGEVRASPARRTPCSATRASRSATTSTALDLVQAFWQFFQAPRPGEVYNIGGGPLQQLLDARSDRDRASELTGRPLTWTYSDTSRAGDHIWWVSDVRKFASHYPGWSLTYSLERTIAEIHGEIVERDAAARAR